jgi:hypothetical protein
VLGFTGGTNPEIYAKYGLDLKRVEPWFKRVIEGRDILEKRGRRSFLSDANIDTLRAQIEVKSASQDAMVVKEGMDEIRKLLRKEGRTDSVN